MLNFFFGILATIAILAFGGFCYRLGTKSLHKNKNSTESDVERKRRERLEELNSGYNQVLNYSIEQAFKSRRKDA